MERTELIGRMGEIKFALEAISNGLTVLYPEGVHGYDCVVCYNDKYTKVQIKTTSVIDAYNRYRWHTQRNGKGSEVYVLHALNSDMFWMYYKSEIDFNNKFSINLSNINNGHLNNWGIFR